MSGIVGVASAMSALKALKDIAESMVSVRDAKAFNAKLIEFQARIIDAQDSVFAAQEERTALVDRVRELEKQIADAEAWTAEKQRYELKQLSELGTFAYVLKEEAAGGEPLHRICAACYQHGKKSILQAMPRLEARHRIHACPACRAEVVMGW